MTTGDQYELPDLSAGLDPDLIVGSAFGRYVKRPDFSEHFG